MSRNQTLSLLNKATAALTRELAAGAVGVTERAEGLLEDFRKRLKSRIPDREHSKRYYWGRRMDLEELELCMRAANGGRMRLMTDFSREAMQADGHLSGIVQKRINRLAGLGYEVAPAQGRRVDDVLAQELAAMVEDELQAVDMNSVIQNQAWGVWDGRAAHELIWEDRGGCEDLKAIEWIHPNRLSFGPQREVRVTDQWEVGEFLPVGLDLCAVRNKFLVYKPQLFCDYAEYEGLHRRCVFWSLFARFGVRERLILIELFSKPWRIGTPSADADWDLDADDAAYDALSDLGGNDTATLPPGYNVLVDTPGQGSSVPHSEAIMHAELSNSKLVLGNTSSTDATAVGLGGGLADAHLSEQDLVILADGRRMMHPLRLGLSRAIVEVKTRRWRLQNPQLDLASHIPWVKPKVQSLVDPAVERERLKTANDLGMPIAASEAYEVLGLRQPEADEAVVVQVTTEGLAGTETRSRIVYPPGEAPLPGELSTPPMEPAEQVQRPGTKPEAIETEGVPVPEEAELAAEPPGPSDAQVTADHLNELQLPQCEHGRPNSCPLCGVKRGARIPKRGEDGQPVLNDDGKPVFDIHWVPIG